MHLKLRLCKKKVSVQKRRVVLNRYEMASHVYLYSCEAIFLL